ncbi:3-isopropylmalate dehydratase (small subunit) [Petrocella atlantisensis]|uniref:3-isopropylmalate dehydratase small subunit n=1 Tax=Petrocella atlantisensis TaxID=2173034 RepID=A0A3P7RUT2_9FIRM|nr:3-isopropylmalate dehydratase small subunit [Petrocella atlantisensis]MCF8018997.1 3-isopropylmalate dehydratase small subunit [Vallitaleaceae bacterium]VDN46556.1 3-isopropylmalate dehydratase (small subunit) [Petrocella atlantisensis]
MEPYKKINGIVMPIDRTNIDTDAIIPKQFLKRIERSGFGQYVFYEFRYDEKNQPIEDSIFNMPRYEGASVLISRANFGCGSSREHAPWALEDYGFKVIIAPSYADIFHNNCFNNGILPIELDNSMMDVLFEKTYAKEGYKLEVDLEAQTIKDNDGLEIKFDINPFHKHKLLNGLDDIGLTLLKEDKILKYEKEHHLV